MGGNQEDNKSTGWLENLTEGGLPQLLAGPAGKAISRLIGAGVEIPAAWLEQKAQEIRDETKAKSIMMETLAAKSAELGLGDPKLLDRGLNSLLGKAYRQQENREAVAVKALEQLADDPAPPDSAGPSDDWMNLFEEHASKASSEYLRDTWARVLAGEIRKPTSFSLATLQLISILDAAIAEAAEVALGCIFAGSYAIFGQAEGDFLDKLVLARSVGIINNIDTDISVTMTVGKGSEIWFPFGTGARVEAVVESGSKLEIGCTAVTRVGKELLEALNPEPVQEAIDALVERLKNVPSVERITVRRTTDMGSWKNELVWTKPQTT